MKAKNQLLKGIITLWMLLSAALGVMAQTDNSPTQEVCPGTEPYLITPGNDANTFLWSISSGTSGTDWTIESPTTAATNIIWGPTVTPQTYTVTFREVDPVTECFDEVILQVTVNPAPTVPITNDQRECQQNPIQTLTATATVPDGVTVVWYDAAEGGNIVDSPTLNTPTSVTYYAEAQIGSCVSPTRTAVILTIDPAPEAVVASDQRECQQNPIQTLTATATVPDGVTVVWYDAAIGGNIVDNPILNAPTSVTYYAEAQVGSCTSPTRTAVTLTIDPALEIPIASDQRECEQNPIQTLTATATVPDGVTVVWYDAATGGNIVDNPTLNTPTSVTYYAEAQIGTCTSSTRTPVVLAIEPAPLPTIGGPDAMCAATELNVYNTEEGMTNYAWIVSAGGTITAGGTPDDNTVTVTWVSDGPQTVSVNYENTNGCSAEIPAVRSVTVMPIPNTSPIYHN